VLESSGVKAVLEASYDRDYGARPVERYLEKTVVTALSRMMISGELASGTIVHIEAEEAPDANVVELSKGSARLPAKKKAKKSTGLRYRVEEDKVADGMQGIDSDDTWEMMSD
jgi:ATP-dependent Clp protease ATP-binding subunit ClpA